LSSLNPALLSSSETLINLGVKSPTKSLSESAQCQQVIGGTYFAETLRLEALHCCLEIGKSQPRSKVGNFECMLWLNGSFFGIEHWGFLKEGVKTYLMAPMSPLNSPTFFHRRIYSLWSHHQFLRSVRFFETNQAMLRIEQNLPARSRKKGQGVARAQDRTRALGESALDHNAEQ
jgi:hypothetical protein